MPLGLIPSAWAIEKGLAPYPFGDPELVTITLTRDREPDIVRKLGSHPCVVPAPNRPLESLFYKSADGAHLRFDVGSDGLESMTMSADPIVSGVCYAPVGRSLKIETGKGVRLGDPLDNILGLYGQPTEQFAVGTLVRCKWDTANELDRYYEWDLVFREGRLVEWSALSRDYSLARGVSDTITFAAERPARSMRRTRP